MEGMKEDLNELREKVLMEHCDYVNVINGVAQTGSQQSLDIFKKDLDEIMFLTQDLEKLFSCNEIELKFWLEQKISINSYYLAPQFPVGRRIVDFAVWDSFFRPNQYKIAVEIDGSRFHTGLLNTIKGNERDLELKKQGWEIIHLTGQDVYHDIDGCLSYIEERKKKMLDVLV